MIADKRQLLSEILSRRLRLLQKKNPKISLRSFAKKIGLSSSAVSEIISGKRSLSKQKVLSLIPELDLTANEMELFTTAYDIHDRISQLKDRRNGRTEILVDEPLYDLMTDWKYFAFMALTRTSDFRSDEDWIAKRLGISRSVVKSMTDRLITLNIITRDRSGRLKDNNACYRTSKDFPDKMIRDRQSNGLAVLQNLLRTGVSTQFGCFSTITTDTSKLEDAKVMCEDFLKKLSLFLCDGHSRTEVFELQIQLFPRSLR